MRPIRLTLDAFGPYSERQVVDFDAALKAGLFGVYGPTGAGKSSIFSAIAFALFGEAAKGEQDIATLRSDHADEDVLTEVELVFELGNRRYCVRRRPTQSRPARRGGGMTTEQHAAWLFDASGLALDDISPENSGEPIAEKKVGDVDEAVRRLLGYGADQFRQIVLLPQGRFETFLTANTKDRLSILSDLFDVSVFRRLAAQLKDEAVASRANIAAQHTAIRARIEQLGFATLEELVEAADTARVGVEPLEAAFRESRALHAQTLKDVEKARSIAERFTERDEAEAHIQALDACAEEIERKKSDLKGLQTAAALADADAQRLRARTSLTEREDAFVQVQSRLQTGIDLEVSATKGLDAALSRRGEIDALKSRRSVLEQLVEASAALGPFRVALKGAEMRLDASKSSCDRAAEQHAVLVGQSDSVNKQIEIASETRERRMVLEARKRELDETLKAVRARDAASADLDKARKAHDQAESELREAERLERDAETIHADAQSVLEAAQAVHLAATLVDGAPCPVCGALEHPAPAIGDRESAGRHDRWKETRAVLEGARKSREARTVALATLSERLVTCQRVLEGLADSDDAASELQSSLDAVNVEMTALGQPADLGGLRAQLASCGQEIAASRESLAAFREQQDRDGRALAAAEQSLKDALARIPEDLRGEGAIEAGLEEVVRECERLEGALARAEEDKRKAAESLAALRVSAEKAKDEVERSARERAQTEDAFQKRLSATGLSEDAYASNKSRLEEQSTLESEIKCHEEAIAAAKDRLSRAVEKIVDLDRPDVTGMEAALTVAEEKERAAQSSLLEAVGRTRSLEGAVADLQSARIKLESLEADHAPLGAVADTVNGTNSYNMNLETYAIAAMFDQVLAAANLRLGPMSGHRYSLQRRSEPGKGRGGRGLDMEVFDVFSGKTRPTNTLSGGESFQAALSLALGLSDVVERFSGGIRLDMIFIDEGFGSLDANSLDQALQALQDLVGQSRAVGLISHVELVQQVIPVGFQIEKGARGSRVAVRSA
jgi:exonuclease SbcC